MKVLMTAFDPFGGESINPAFEAVKLMPDKIADAEIVKLEVPTVFHKSIEKMEKKIENEDPDIIICVGQAGGRFDMTVERAAINVDDARIPDNEDNQPIDEKIFADGENAYFANIPIKAMVKEIKDNEIPASVSNSAGTFVCNHIFYGLMYLIDKKFSGKRGGFIHVPYIPAQVVEKKNQPSMSVDDITKALELAVKAAVENREDIKEIGGKIS